MMRLLIGLNQAMFRERTVATQNSSRLIVTLSRDENLRRQFKRHPQKICSAFGLSYQETQTLKKIELEILERRSLIAVRKRLKRIKSYFPCVSSLLHKQLLTRFIAYCNCFPENKKMLRHDDARQFLLYLISLSDYPVPGYPYANEIIDFELTRLHFICDPLERASEESIAASIALLSNENWTQHHAKIFPALQLKQYKYPIDTIMRQLLANKRIYPYPEDTCILFLQPRKKKKMIVKRLRRSTHIFLERCTGDQPILKLLRNMQPVLRLRGLEITRFENEGRDFLLQLAKEGAVQIYMV